jgi:hypothetical protein
MPTILGRIGTLGKTKLSKFLIHADCEVEEWEERTIYDLRFACSCGCVSFEFAESRDKDQPKPLRRYRKVEYVWIAEMRTCDECGQRIQNDEPSGYYQPICPKCKKPVEGENWKIAKKGGMRRTITDLRCYGELEAVKLAHDCHVGMELPLMLKYPCKANEADSCVPDSQKPTGARLPRMLRAQVIVTRITEKLGMASVEFESIKAPTYESVRESRKKKGKQS